MTEPLIYRHDLRNAFDLEPGEFCYRRDEGSNNIKWLHFWPRDCRCALSAAISPHRNGVGAQWQLSGTVEAPTLHPSVNAEGIWHGWLVDGVATP